MLDEQKQALVPLDMKSRRRLGGKKDGIVQHNSPTPDRWSWNSERTMVDHAALFLFSLSVLSLSVSLLWLVVTESVSVIYLSLVICGRGVSSLAHSCLF